MESNRVWNDVVGEEEVNYVSVFEEDLPATPPSLQHEAFIISINHQLIHRIFIPPFYSGHSLHRQSSRLPSASKYRVRPSASQLSRKFRRGQKVGFFCIDISSQSRKNQRPRGPSCPKNPPRQGEWVPVFALVLISIDKYLIWRY